MQRKTPKGWHRFSKSQLPKDKIDPTTSNKIIDSWVTLDEGDGIHTGDEMVNIYKTKDKRRPYLVWTTAHGRLANIPDKKFGSLTKAKNYAIRIMKKINGGE